MIGREAKLGGSSPEGEIQSYSMVPGSVGHAMGAESPRDVQSGTTLPTVSVVDSDAGVRQGLRSLLETLGLQVATFKSAEEFLGGLEGGAPDCLITELELPGMSGMDLQIRLREMNLALPVILLATFAEVSTAVRCMRLGAADFIEKPFVGRSVLERVIQVLDLPGAASSLRGLDPPEDWPRGPGPGPSTSPRSPRRVRSRKRRKGIRRNRDGPRANPE